MKTIITAIAFTLATTAAQASPASDFCHALANITEATAEARDAGVSRKKVKSLWAQGDLGHLLGSVLDLVDLAYDSPWETPTDLAVGTYKTCMVTLSTPV